MSFVTPTLGFSVFRSRTLMALLALRTLLYESICVLSWGRGADQDVERGASQLLVLIAAFGK